MGSQFPYSDKSPRRLAVVTGASSGIGYELAKVFAENGFDLLVVAEDDAINEAGNAFRALGGYVESIQADLATFNGVDEVYRRIKVLGRPVEALALNAGVGVGGYFKDTDLLKELKMIQLNIVSAVHLAKHVLKDMLEVNHGRILFTSSIAGEMPGPYYAVYAASKAFIQSFAMALHEELKDTGVHVTSLQPGATDTNFFARAGMENTKAGVSKKDSPADVARDGFNALMADKNDVVAGSFMNKVQATVAKFVSEERAAKMQGAQTKPGSGVKK